MHQKEKVKRLLIGCVPFPFFIFRKSGKTGFDEYDAQK
jgi:hypothetical protein